MPNKTDLHDRIEELENERDSWKSLVKSANIRIAELKAERNEAQAKADKLFEENYQLKNHTATISVSLIASVLKDAIAQMWVVGKPNRYDLHKWASTIAQEIMVNQAKGTRIEVDTLFIEPADLRIEYPTGDHDG